MEKSKMILWGIVIAIVIVLIFSSLGFRITRSEAGRGGATGQGTTGNNNYASLPEKCRPPAGQDIESWKEYLGHHAETQDCLNYFN